MMRTEDDNITINGVPYCAMITDLIFRKKRRRAAVNVLHIRPYKSILQFRKSATDRILPNAAFLMITMTLTEEQQDFLDELETGSVWAVSLKKPEDVVSVRVAISFVGCGRDIRKRRIWLIRILILIRVEPVLTQPFFF